MKKLLIALLLVPTIAWAATQGTAGTSSQVTLNIQFSIPNTVRVTELTDINLGTFDPATGGDQTFDEEICVYSRSTPPGGVYNITFSSANSAAVGVFHLNNGQNDLAYDILFDDDLTPADGTDMDHAVQLTAQQGSNSPTCSNATNASFRVTILETDINLVTAGTYQDVLTITVSSI